MFSLETTNSSLIIHIVLIGLPRPLTDFYRPFFRCNFKKSYKLYTKETVRLVERIPPVFKFSMSMSWQRQWRAKGMLDRFGTPPFLSKLTSSLFSPCRLPVDDASADSDQETQDDSVTVKSELYIPGGPLERSCLTFDNLPGVCTPVQECYPYTKAHQLENLDTWVIGTKGTCNYHEPTGRQVRPSHMNSINWFASQILETVNGPGIRLSLTISG